MKYLILFISCTALAEVYGQKLSLSDAVNIGLKNSLDVQLSKNYVNIAEISNYVGMAGGLPLITAAGADNYAYAGVHQRLNTGEVIQRNGANANNLQANLTAGILLYNGSRVMATRKRLAELETQSRDQLNSSIQNVMASIMTAYFDVLRQQGYIKTFDQAIDVARKKLTIVKTQMGVGLANNADLFQSQVDLNNLLQAEQTQDVIVAQAKAELLRLLTLNTDSAIVVEDSIQVDPDIRLGDVLSRLSSNPDILAADEQVRINQLIIKETAAQRYPVLKASTGYNYNGNNAGAGQLLLNQSYGPFIGLSLNIPIYNGDIYKRQVKIADINAKNATIQKEILLRDYSADVVKIFKAYTVTLQELESQRNNYHLAQQLLDLVIQRFQFHQATILEVTQAQQSFVTAAYSLVNYSFVAKAAEIELKRVASQLVL